MQEMAPGFSKFSWGGGGGGGRGGGAGAGGGMPLDPPSKLPRWARSCSADNHTRIHF